MPGSFRIARILGIDIRVHLSWLLIFFLVTFSLANEVFPFNPSAENLARHFFQELKKTYPVRSVTVWESEDASATYAEDD